MLENQESFIYIKNNNEVNLKTDRLQNDETSATRYLNYNISDFGLISSNKEFHLKDSEAYKNAYYNSNTNANNQTYEHNSFIQLQSKSINMPQVVSNREFYNTDKGSKCEHKQLLKKNYIDDEGPKIISLDSVPLYRKLFIQVHPFILNGYRIHHEISDCFASVFKLHNETLNIWSHLIPFVSFLGLFMYILISK